MPSPAEYAEQARHDERMAEREELKRLRDENERLKLREQIESDAAVQAAEAAEEYRVENERLRERLRHVSEGTN
jgi:hypothetical protein